MRVVLVGADCEENLGLCAIAAAVESAGHTAEVLAFNAREALDRIADDIAVRAPEVVGLSIQFQHRSFDFLSLARALRTRGYRGHITCGGQFPSLAFKETLSDGHGVDSVVMYEGEHTIVELLSALGAGRSLSDVPGLALPSPLGPVRTTPRALEHDLDALPVARRYRPHTIHFEVPFIPIMGGRGCWGSCSYCSITTWYRDARKNGGGLMLRLRSPENVAAEMAMLWHEAGASSAIFCFHDDNFLLPRPADTLARVRAIRASLDEFGVGAVGLVGKARPDCVTAELLRELRALGLMRLYIGVENVSENGSASLNRKAQTARVREALAAAREAGIFTCYNLLLFEPETTLGDVRENIAFVREHSSHPVNFCRAEPYFGTPLARALSDRGALGGSYLGFDYRLRDDRAELLFRVCSAAFRERNFAPNGVGNRYMGLGYAAQIFVHFALGESRRRAQLVRRANDLTRGIALETADFLEEAVRLVERHGTSDHDGVERETALLGLRIAAADAAWHVAIDDLTSDMQACARDARTPAPPPPRRAPNRRLTQAISGIAFASALGWLTGCGGKTEVPAPADTGTPPKDSTVDSFVADPVPPDSTVNDMAPPDDGIDVWADPVPIDTGVSDGMKDLSSDPVPIDTGVTGSLDVPVGRPKDHWQDTSPRRSCRSSDLALSMPPSVSLSARREGERVRVRLGGHDAPLTFRWQSQGMIEGDGREVVWEPGSRDDLLRVAVRTPHGVAVLALRAREVPS